MSFGCGEEALLTGPAALGRLLLSDWAIELIERCCRWCALLRLLRCSCLLWSDRSLLLLADGAAVPARCGLLGAWLRATKGGKVAKRVDVSGDCNTPRAHVRR